MKNNQIKELASAFEQATSISLALVAFPVLFLVAGVALDKTLGTTPLFILAGIIGGVVVGIWRAKEAGKRIKE